MKLIYVNCVYKVTMQAQQMAPPDMKCKDKFLIQSTIVPFEANLHEDLTSTYNLVNGLCQ